MKNMKIKAKLLTGFLIVAALTAVVGVIGAIGLLTLSNNETALFNYGLEGVYNAEEMSVHMHEERVAYRDIVIHMDEPEARDKAIETLRVLEDEMHAVMEVFPTTIHPDNTTDKPLYDELVAEYTGTFADLKQQIIEAAQANDIVKSEQLLSEAGQSVNYMIEKLDQLVGDSKTESDHTQSADTATADLMMLALIIVSVVAVVVAIVLGLYIARLISVPMNAMQAIMEQIGERGDMEVQPERFAQLDKLAQSKDETGSCLRAIKALYMRILSVSDSLKLIADGDLTGKIDVASDKDSLGHSLMNMQDKLNANFGEINQSSLQVSTGASQVAQGAQNLAQGSTEQAASIQELSATIAEVFKETQQNSQNCTQALAVNNEAGTLLQESMVSMDKMLDSMRGISEASENISKIIKVIDDIAFQTNILALNAAVEAARAGQHGKGFAVVADEVRNLAAKSAAAAKETSELIAGSTQRVHEGNQIVENTNASMSACAQRAQVAMEAIAAVEKASHHQETSLSQINEGVDQISAVVQTNTATAEQSAAAAEEMSSQSSLLTSIVGRFKLKGGTPPPQSAPDYSPAPAYRESYPPALEMDSGYSGDKY